MCRWPYRKINSLLKRQKKLQEELNNQNIGMLLRIRLEQELMQVEQEIQQLKRYPSHRPVGPVVGSAVGSAVGPVTQNVNLTIVPPPPPLTNISNKQQLSTSQNPSQNPSQTSEDRVQLPSFHALLNSLDQQKDKT